MNAIAAAPPSPLTLAESSSMMYALGWKPSFGKGAARPTDMAAVFVDWQTMGVSILDSLAVEQRALGTAEGKALAMDFQRLSRLLRFGAAPTCPGGADGQ